MSHRIMFLRNPSNGHPVGCVAIKVNRASKTASYQLSVLNPMDVFERSVARQIAIGRLVEKPLSVKISADASMHDISHAVMVDIAHFADVPSRAVKAARTWIKYNS